MDSIGSTQYLPCADTVRGLNLDDLTRYIVADAVGRVTLDKTALVHQPDAGTAFGLIHVRRRDDDGDALNMQTGQDVPELTA